MKKIFLYFFSLLILIITQKSFSQTAFCSKVLLDIYNKLPATTKSDIINNVKLNIGFIEKKSNCKDYTLKYVIDSTTLIHLGINIFKKYNEEDKEVMLFIERSFLELLLNNNINFGINDHFEIDINGQNLNEYKIIPEKNIIYILTNYKSFAILYDGLKVKVYFEDEIGNKIKMNFPANYMLISGMDKKESDDFLFHKISKCQFAKVDINKDSLLSGFANTFNNNDSVITLLGDSLFPGLNKKIYAKEISGKQNIIFSKEYPGQSVFNIFSVPMIIQNSLILELSYQYYGNQIKMLKLPLNCFYSLFFHSYDIFTSIENQNGTIIATVIFKHKKMPVNNMLIAKLNINDIFKENNLIKATIYGNIRNDNISNIFAPNIDSEPKYEFKINQ